METSLPINGSSGGGLGGRRMPYLSRVGVPLALVLSTALMGYALFLTSFTLHVQGLVGAALGPERANRPYSVVSLGLEVGNVSSLAPSWVLLALQITFMLTTTVLPLAWGLHCLALWCVPLRPRQLRSMLIASETLYAWAMLDVLVVIVAASLLELDQVAKFTLGDECDGLNAALSSHPSLGGLLPGEASCFGVVPTLEAGYWLLVAATLVSTVAGGVATLTAHIALEEHVARARLAASASSLSSLAASLRGSPAPPRLAPGLRQFSGGAVVPAAMRPAHRRSASGTGEPLLHAPG